MKKTWEVVNKLIKKYWGIGAAILVLTLICKPLFYELDADPIKIWDESRYAVNAIEMSETDNPIVVTYNGKPDYWNSKPPLAVWIMSVSMQIFGFNEFGVRFPSAIAGWLVMVVILLFFSRIVKNINAGLIAVLFLAVTPAIIRYHVTRTGDVDGLLTLFILFYTLSFFSFLLTEGKWKILFAYTFGLGMLLAFFTKSVAALMPLPGLFIVSFLYKNYKQLFTNKHLYFSVIGAIVIGLSYYLLRSIYDPGYIDAVLKQDWGMYVTESAKKNYGTDFYMNQMKKFTLLHFYNYIPFTLIFVFFTKSDRLKKTMIYSTIFSVIFLLIISFSNTQNPWYDAPVYPFIAILFGSAIIVIYENMVRYIRFIHPYIFGVLFILFIAKWFYSPYKDLMKTIQPTKNVAKPSWECNYMRELYRNNKNINNYSVSTLGRWPDQMRFYQLIYNKEDGYNIALKNDRDYALNEIILTCHKPIRKYIEENYKFEILDEKNKNCKIYKIIEPITK